MVYGEVVYDVGVCVCVFVFERLCIEITICLMIQVKAVAPTGTCDGVDDAR